MMINKCFTLSGILCDRVIVFNATFNNISVNNIVAFSFICGGNWPEKTTDLSQVTDNEDTEPKVPLSVNLKSSLRKF